MHTIVWRRLSDGGLEYCNISFANATTIRGKVISIGEPTNSFIDYQVTCDDQGNTSEVSIVFQQEDRNEKMRLIRNDKNRWQVNGHEMKDLSGILDIDIGVTPSTNVLPIRRFNLAVGESRIFTAAWVRFPQLTVQPLRQEYTRIDEHTYRYTSIDSGYTALLQVNAYGIVGGYEGEWTRI